MYVRAGTTVSPSASGLRGLGDSPTLRPNPFQNTASGAGSAEATVALLAEAGVTSSVLQSALGSCASLNPDRTADCFWSHVEGLILSSPRAAEILSAITTLEFSAFQAALRVADQAVSLALQAVGSLVWRAVQAKAAAALATLTGAGSVSYQQEFAENYARGRNRTPEEGGGHTLVDASGQEVGVLCPAYAENELRDANGNVIGYSMRPPSVFPGSSPCPKGVEIPAGSGPGKSGIQRKFLRGVPNVLRAFPTGRVKGRVVDANGKPVSGAEIRIGSPNNPAAGTTDAKGDFDVRSVAAENLKLYVSKDGYEGAVVENLTVTADKTADVGNLEIAMALKGEGEGDQGSPWYTSWWFVGGAAVLAGGVAYLVYRSRKAR